MGDDPFNGWTVGRLRKELRDLPDDIPVVVNVPVACPGLEGTAFVPIALDEVGFSLTDPDAEPENQILRLFNIDCVPETTGELIYVAFPPTWPAAG